jgi:hypothetical protein
VFRFPNLFRRRPGPEDFVIEKKLKATTHREGPMGTMIRTSRFVEHKWCMIMSVDNAWANNCAALNQNNSCRIYIYFFPDGRDGPSRRDRRGIGSSAAWFLACMSRPCRHPMANCLLQQQPSDRKGTVWGRRQVGTASKSKTKMPPGQGKGC